MNSLTTNQHVITECSSAAQDQIKTILNMGHIIKKVSAIALAFAISAEMANSQETPFISESLSKETVVGPNGEVTVKESLDVDALWGIDKKVVDEISPGVFQIRGWGIAHTIAIDAPEGWIIVDTGDSTSAAEQMRRSLEEKVGGKIKVSAILYTHSHYTDGTDAWLDEGAEIWGHEHLDRHKRSDSFGILSGNFQTRALIQFGVLHPTEGPDAFPNKLGFGAEKFVGEKSYRPPTKTFEDGKIINLTIAGEPVEIAPNRTDVQDSVGFYFPKRSALVTNAMVGASIFNLYSLRGDMYRNPLDYVEAHDWALSKNAEVVADIHALGIKGKEAVQDALERASDQMQLIHDQTFRMVALGMDARRAAENVYMPEHLRKSQETYGQVESHAKQVYNGRLGWMGNDVYEINPLSVKEETRRSVELMGGGDKVRSAAASAAKSGGFENWSWALKLTTMLLELNPDDPDAREIRAKAARAIGQRTTSANARGWYITEALAMEESLKLGDLPVTLESARILLGTPSVEQVMELSLEDSFQYIRYLVDPRKAEDTRLVFTVSVGGSDKPVHVELRNGVVVITADAEKGTTHLNVSLRDWAGFVVGQRSLAAMSPVFGQFESVLDRRPVPKGSKVLDEKLDEAAKDDY